MLLEYFLLLASTQLLSGSPLQANVGRSPVQNVRADERLFFGGGKEEEDYFAGYDYQFDPSLELGPGHGAPGHHFMDREDPDTDYGLFDSVADFSFADFIQSLLNLRQ